VRRLGLTVGKRVGNAVTRNRVKRLLREYFRNCKDKLPASTDIVISAKVGAAGLDYAGMCRELRDLLEPATVSSRSGYDADKPAALQSQARQP